MIERFSVNINAETAARVRALCEKDGISATELLRRMVGLYAFASEHEGRGHRLQVVDGARVVDKIKLL